MAEQDEVPVPTQELYMSSLPTPNGNIASQSFTTEPGDTSLFQVQINPDNPDQAALVPAPGADGRLLDSLADTALRVFDSSRLPGADDKFLTVEQPTMLEKIGENWKVVSQGKIGFSPNAAEPTQVFGNKPEAGAEAQAQMQLTTEAEGLATEAAITTGATRTEAKADLEEVANRAEQGPDAATAAYADELRDKAATLPGESTERNLTTSFPLDREDAPEGAGQTPQEAYLANLTRLGATVQLDNSRPELTANVSYAADHANADELAELLKTSGRYGPARDEQQTAAQQQAPAATPATPGAAGTEPVGELQIQWKQKGDEVAPLLEMRAYLDQLKDAGIAVGAMKMERGEDGKLTGSFGVSYDPESNKLAQLEGTLQGLKQVGNGVEVIEKPAQTAARRQEVGYDGDYEPQRSKQVKEAFGVKQWDALSANLTAVPKTALTLPEQIQQSAGEKRVEQLAQQQGTTKEQILKDGKSIFDIDTEGNPASVFLKNFYAHLTGNPKSRQTLEVDYDKTRQDLQARLLKKAGSAQLDQGAEQVKQAPQGQTTTTPTVPAVAAVIPKQSAAAKAPTLFEEADVPQKVLASLGLNTADLEQSGQLQKLLNGQKTDLLPMQVVGKDGQETVKFDGKMVLHREPDGTATLKMELPQEKLVIPNEIGGQPFTPEQRQKLETEGNAGLIRGLKDEKGQEYNGYVSVDLTMNKVVILPENKVALQETIAGVKLSPEQSHDLKEGKAVALANMVTSDGGRKFDGTAQVNAAKASIEIKPAAHELQKRQAPQVVQSATSTTPAVKTEAPKVETPKAKRGPRL